MIVLYKRWAAGQCYICYPRAALVKHCNQELLSITDGLYNKDLDLLYVPESQSVALESSIRKRYKRAVAVLDEKKPINMAGLVEYPSCFT